MSLLPVICCVNCCELYDDTRKPCLGECNDSICLPCKEKLPQNDCPLCGQKGAFSKTTINYGLTNMIDSLTGDKFTDVLSQSLKDEKGTCGECSDESKQLRICLTCAHEASVVVFDGSDWKVNPTGGRLSTLFKLQKFSICSNCKLDGKHAEHKLDFYRKLYTEEKFDFDGLSMYISLQMVEFHPKVLGSRLCYQFLYFCKRMSWDRFPLEEISVEFVELTSGSEIREELNKIKVAREKTRSKALAVEKKWKIVHVDFQKIIVESFQGRDRGEEAMWEKFVQEMEKIGAKLLEDAGVKEGELDGVDEQVKLCILQYCEALEGNVFDDKDEAEHKLQIAAKKRKKHLQELKEDVELLRLKRSEDNRARKELDMAILAWQKSLLNYEEARIHYKFCTIVCIEMLKLKEKCGFKLEHPNLDQFVEMFTEHDSTRNTVSYPAHSFMETIKRYYDHDAYPIDYTPRLGWEREPIVPEDYL